MIMAEIIALGLLLSLLTGGSLRQLAEERLSGESVFLALMPLQLLWPQISAWLGLACALSTVAWLVMMAVLAFVLMANSLRRWMLAFAALGVALNVLVIGVNGAMPVRIGATSEIGGSREVARMALDDDCLHSELDSDTRLPQLSDVIAVPGPSWQRSVVSIGDLLLALGLGAWIFVASRPLQKNPHHHQ